MAGFKQAKQEAFIDDLAVKELYMPQICVGEFMWDLHLDSVQISDATFAKISRL